VGNPLGGLSTAVDDGRLYGGLDGTAAGASTLEAVDNLLAGIIRDLAEDDVLAVEPGGDDSGDEELRAVAGSC
jgi:hypothetical protein